MKQREPLLGLELTTDRHPTTSNQKRNPLHHPPIYDHISKENDASKIPMVFVAASREENLVQTMLVLVDHGIVMLLNVSELL